MPSPNDLSQANLPPFANQLIQSGYITMPQLQQALIEKRKTHRPLIEILPMVTGRPLPPDLLHRYRQEQLAQLKSTYGVDYFDPETETIDWKTIEHLFKTLISFEICRRYQILPLQKQASNPDVLCLAMVDPANPEVLDDLRRILQNKELQFERRAIALPDYQKLIEVYRAWKAEAISPYRSPQDKDLETLVDATDIFEDVAPAPQVTQQTSPEDLGLIHQANQSSVVTLVNNILVRAIENKASEIHLEPQEYQLTIRFRQDGLLRSGFDSIPREEALAVLSRFKILANLEVGQRQKPQQGKMTKAFSGRKIDFRLHTLPCQHGEKIVLRIFDSRSTLWPLDELIVNEETRKLVQAMLDRPGGLILLASPSGGGCSTTFYSLLASRNQGSLNIVTAEDPIERTLNGVTQVEIDRSRGLEYDSILPSFQSQDVDIIGIDRLRDHQTAASAIESALTGHLVLSSLATNDAVSTIARLSQLTDPRSVADTLIGVIDQRLARRVCPVCRLKHHPSTTELTKFGLSSEQVKQFFKANTLNAEEVVQAREKGRLCRHCNGVGYQGQIGVFEVMTISPRLKTLIASNASTETLQQAARQEGGTSLLAYGLELVGQGHTTLEELDRVMGDNLSMENPSPPFPSSGSLTALERILELERLLGAIGSELQALKQEISFVAPLPVIPPPIIYEEIKESLPWESGGGDWMPEKETIVSSPAIYEELTDPGDWENLKRELDPNKDTIISIDSLENDLLGWGPPTTSGRSVPDPWS
jgi:type IV pilus assembly protein PilB